MNGNEEIMPAGKGVLCAKEKAYLCWQVQLMSVIPVLKGKICQNMSKYVAYLFCA